MISARHSLFVLFSCAVLYAPLQADSTIWELTPDSFRTSDDPYQGWKVVKGSADVNRAGVAPSVVLHAGGGREVTLFHYVPFSSVAREGGELYLQIEAEFPDSDRNGNGLIANVSRDGGALGVVTNGLTTFSLSQQPYFRESGEQIRQWAMRLYTLSPEMRIYRIALRSSIEEGVTLEHAKGHKEGMAEAGDVLTITFRTPDPELRSQSSLPAELIAYHAKSARQGAPWDGAGGPDLTLEKTGDGVFSAHITVDERTLALLQSAPRFPSLGVRVRAGDRTFTGWMRFNLPDESVNDPVDWQHQQGQESEGRKAWKELTQGEELARGKQVRLIPLPNYRLTRDDNDPYDLTDGKLSTRLDDRIWFQRDAVGWYGAGGAVPFASMLIDLEEVQPIGRIAIRLLGGNEQGSLRFPNAIEFFASEDGKTFHLLQGMQKLMPAERALSDFKTAFYVPEEGKAFVHGFTCNEAVKARYVVIRLQLEAAAFSDEISILKAPEGTAFRSLDEYPRQVFHTEGVVVRPRQPEISLIRGMHLNNWLSIESYEEAPYNKLDLEVDLPRSLVILPVLLLKSTESLQIAESPDAPEGRRIYLISGVETQKGGFPLYIVRRDDGELSKEDEVILTAIIDGARSHQTRYPVREYTLPKGPFPEKLDVSLAWMQDHLAIRWPNFTDEFRQLGFNHVSLFPRFWQQRNAQRTWIDATKTAGLKLLSEAREKGYKVLMNDSPFHEMVYTFDADRRGGTLSPEAEAGFYLKDSSGNETKFPNPFYRGTHYQREMDRITALAELTQPDQIYWDIELWWKSVRQAQKDSDISRRWKESGKEWEDFVTDAGKQMLADLRAAAMKGMKNGVAPIIGLYGAYATEKLPTDGLFEWTKSFPETIDISMPSLYVQGRTPDVLKRISDEYPKVKRQVIPWLTAGTYGPVAPQAMEPMVLGVILSGARGITYYEYRDFDPLHFYYHTRALAALGRYADLLEQGAPANCKGSNIDLSYTCFASESEALIMVGNFARTQNTKTTLPPIFTEVEIREIREGKEEAIKVENGKWNIDVPPGTFRLYHLKGVKSS